MDLVTEMMYRPVQDLLEARDRLPWWKIRRWNRITRLMRTLIPPADAPIVIFGAGPYGSDLSVPHDHFGGTLRLS